MKPTKCPEIVLKFAKKLSPEIYFSCWDLCTFHLIIIENRENSTMKRIYVRQCRYIDFTQCRVERPVMTESSRYKIARCEERKCTGSQRPACNCKPRPLHYLTKVISTGHVLKHTTYTHTHNARQSKVSVQSLYSVSTKNVHIFIFPITLSKINRF